jgi:hypothetical protein
VNGARTFNANARLAQIALWIGGERWLDHSTERVRATRRGIVTVTFDRAELEALLSGVRGVSRSLLGIAQPVPPPIPMPRSEPPHLRLVSSDVPDRAVLGRQARAEP